MDEVKPPNDESDWGHVDIFLFSNGQQQTPPRKYHLRTSDLNDWNSTLKSLSQLHYENIFSTIDLYTVNGKKVLTPMQISDGVAYVAVPHQDTFIHAGYNDYLMKASRSREKRKSTNFSIAESEANVEANNKINNELEAAEENVLSVLEEEKEITASTLNVISTDVTTKHGVPNQVKNKINTTKIPEKKILNRISNAKNDSFSLSQPTSRKTSMKNKDNQVKKNLKVTTNNVMPIAPISTANNNNNVVRPKTKSITKTNKIAEKDVSALVPINVSTVEENVYKNISYEKNIITESSVLENILDDQELIVVKNPESDMTSMVLDRDKSASVFSRHNKIPSTAHILTPIDESTHSVLNNGVPITIVKNDYGPKHAFTKDLISSANKNLKENCDVGLAVRPEVDDKMLSNIPATESVLAGIDRRVVNLNIKIEVKKGDDVVNTQCNTCLPTMHDITENSSQTNVEDQVFITCPTKSSRLTNNQVTNEKSPKIVVVHCTCCNHHKIDDVIHKIETTISNLGDTNYVIVLPNPNKENNVERYKQDRQTSNTSPPSPSGRFSVAENPVKKALTGTWLHEFFKKIDASVTQHEENVANENINHNNELTQAIITNDVEIVSSKTEMQNKANSLPNNLAHKVGSSNQMRVEMISSKIDVHEVEINKDFNEINKSINDVGVTSSKVEVYVVAQEDLIGNKVNKLDKEISESKIERKSSKTQSKNLFNQETQNTGSSHKILRDSVNKSPKLIRENKDTQTDWCTMLLEARRHEDGLYSFHLPPLHVLKYYGF